MLALWGRALTDRRELPPVRISIAEGRIAAVETALRPLPGDIVVEDGWLAPGLIDIQVNGAGGVDLTSALHPPTALEHVAHTLAQHGVTAFCPTIVSSAEQVIVDRVRAYRPARQRAGAECLGSHVEGPYINPQHRGIHDPAVLREPALDEIARWLEAGPPRIVTLAPELPRAIEAVECLTDAGVLVSIGHSGAEAAACEAALAAGARCATHLFNAMVPFHHRQPGLIGVLLASSAALGVICDGVHLHPLAIDLVVARAGVSRVVLVSDALAAAAAPAGSSVLGDQALVSDGTSVRRADGTLAGSALLVDGCLRNVRRWLPWLTPAEVVAMASQTPADLLGLACKGRLQAGADADVIVLDRDWNVRLTLIGGTIVAGGAELASA